MRRKQLGPYLLENPLGEGGMSAVVRAHHHVTGQAVALKAVLHEVRSNLHSLRREVRALRSIAHPNIVRIIDDDASGAPPWYAMELIDGLPLHKHWAVVEQSQRWRHYLRAFAGVCDALAHMHGFGLVHRDLKPANVVLRAVKDGRYGDAVLVDFGLATLSGGGLGREFLYKRSEIIGTPHYISPEQVQQEHVDARTDLYALGVMLYEVVVGRVPFPADVPFAAMIGHVNEQPEIPREVLNRTPPQLAELIHALLEKQPRNRPGYATDVRAVLATLGDIGSPAPAPPPRTYLYRPALVGREALGARLREIASEASRRGGSVAVTGPAGVGKSRIAIELIRHIHETTNDHVDVLVAEIPNTATSAPLASLRAVFEEMTDICFERGPRFAAYLFGDDASHLARYLPFLEAIPGVAIGAEEHLEPESRDAATIEAISSVLERLAADIPLVIALDDVQWCDPLTRRWLELLPQRRPWDNVPLILITVARDDEPDRVAGLSMDEQLTVTPLPAAAIHEMVCSMTGIAAIPVDFGDAIQAQAQGLPSRVAQWLTSAVSRGALVRDFGRWRFHGVPVDDAAVHDTVAMSLRMEDLLTERVRSLKGRHRAFMELAIVLGPELRTEVLTHFGESEIAIVDDLVKDGIFVEQARGSVRFVSPELYNSARDALGESTRRELHLRAAAILESLGAPEIEIAHHLARAGWRDESRQRLFRAAAVAFSAGEWAEAERLYRAHADLGFNVVDREVTAWSRLAVLAWRHGRAPDEPLQKAHDATGNKCGPLALGEYWRARGLLQRATQPEESRESLLRAQQLFAAHGEWLDERDVSIEVGHAHRRLGDLDTARNVFLAVHDLARKRDDQVGVAMTLGAIGATWLAARRYEIAEHFLTRAVARFREGHHPMRLAETLYNLATCELDVGREAEAIRSFHEVAEIRASTGDARGRAIADSSRAGALIAAGHYDDALAVLLGALATLGRQDDPEANAIAHRFTGQAYARMARYTDAMDHFVRALASAGSRGSAPFVHLDIAELDRRLGMYEDARLQLEKVREHTPDAHAALLWQLQCAFLALAQSGSNGVAIDALKQAVQQMQLPPTSLAARQVAVLERAIAMPKEQLLHGEPPDVVPAAFRKS